MFEKLNSAVANSVIGRWFKLEGSGAKDERPNTRFTTELRAGLATFVTMAYIISVNAAIIGDSGGPCNCEALGGNPSVCLADPGYQSCLGDLRKDLITATAAISAISTICLGLFSNLPIALAPGMGLNAYFAYQVVGFHGTGKVKYETALAAVFIEGILFIGLTVLGLRQILAKAIPASIKVATGAGIGLFLALIGMESSAGIGLIGPNSATIVELGACKAEFKDPVTGACMSHHMENPTTWMGILGFMIMAMLLSYRVKGSIIISIIFISAVSWFRNSEVTYFPYTPAGDTMFDYFKKVVDVPRLRLIGGVLSFEAMHTKEVWIALITFLYVDILDMTGTLFSMAKFAGFLKPNGDFNNSMQAFLTDASSISIGALMGLSPVTAFVESGAGITEGGKTGLTAITTGLFFILSLFFAPIFASFPPWATGPALLIVGVMMSQEAFPRINWHYFPDAVPAFIAIIIMPFTYSIAYGLIGGVVSYIIINSIIFIIRKASGGKALPADFDKKEHWGPKSKEELYPFWVKWMVHKKDHVDGDAQDDVLEISADEENRDPANRLEEGIEKKEAEAFHGVPVDTK
ncbi:hypothetical protein HDV00_000638 [Rhizophlyctis rosea]|nr:hypothetical protein HDV00_000638 [Rhizophlyctis rosea]